MVERSLNVLTHLLIFFYFFFVPSFFGHSNGFSGQSFDLTKERERERRKALRWRCRWAWRCIWWEWFGFLWVVGSSLAWLSLTRSLVLLETVILVLSMSDDPIPDSLALLLCVYVLIFLKFHVFVFVFCSVVLIRVASISLWNPEIENHLG